MKIRALYILAVLAVCILIMPALSQNDHGKDAGQPGSNGPNPGAVNYNQGSIDMPYIDDISDKKAGKPRFFGCSTRLQQLKVKKPVKKHASDKNLVPENGQDGNGPAAEDKIANPGWNNEEPWAHIVPAGGDEKYAEGQDLRPLFSELKPPFIDQNRVEPPKKVLNDYKHKKKIKKIRPLWDENRFPFSPPKKALNDNEHNKKIRPLWDDNPFPPVPPMKSIMGPHISGAII